MDFINHKGLIKKLIHSLALLLFLTTSIKTTESSDEKPEMQLLWEYDAGAKINAAPGIVEKDGLVFFGDDEGDVYCIRLSDGKRIWRESVDIPIKNEIAVDEHVYVTAGSNILSLDIQTGDTNWEYKAQGQIVRAPTIGKERLYFESVKGEKSFVYSINKKEGKKKVSVMGTFEGSSSRIRHGELNPVYANNMLFMPMFIATNMYELITSAPDGVGLYSTSIPSFPSYKSMADDKKIYVTFEKKKIWAYEISELTKVWSFQSNDSIQLPPVIYKDKIIFYENPGYISILSTSDGSVLNKIKLNDPWIKSFTYAEPFLYSISTENRISILDLNSGQTIWTKTYEGEEVVSVKATKDKFIVALSSGKLLCYKNIHYKESEISGEDKTKTDAATSTRETQTKQRIVGDLEWQVYYYSEIIATPAALNNILYVGDLVGTFWAIDERDGKEIWRFETRGSIHSKALIHKKTIYFGSRDTSLYALDVNSGNKKWSFKTGDRIEVTPIIDGNSIYFGSHDGSFYCLNADDGTLKWCFQTGGPISYTGVISDNTVYFSSYDYSIYALNKDTGKLVWNKKMDNIITSSLAVENGTLVFSNLNKFIYALRADNGEKIWWQKINAGQSSPLIVGDTVFIGNNDGLLYALGLKTGRIKWVFRTNGGMISVRPVFYDNAIYFTSEDGKIYGVESSSGAEVFKFEDTISKFRHSTPLAKTGKIYVGSSAKRFYSINLYHPKFLYFHLNNRNNNYKFLAISDKLTISVSDYGYILAREKWNPNKVWSVDLKSYFFMGPVLEKNYLYLFSNENRFCIDITTGKVVWKEVNDNIIMGFTVKDGIIYAQTNKKTFCLIDAKNGKEIRKRDSSKTNDTVIIPIKDKLILIDSLSIEAVNTDTGKSLWQVNANYKRSPIVSCDILYINIGEGSTGKLFAIDVNSGETIWESMENIRALGLSDGLLYASDSASRIYSCNASNGQIINMLDTRIKSSGHILMGKNTIFIYSDDDERLDIFDLKSGALLWSQLWKDHFPKQHCRDAIVIEDSILLLFEYGTILTVNASSERLNFPDFNKEYWNIYDANIQHLQSNMGKSTSVKVIEEKIDLKPLWTSKIEALAPNYIQYSNSLIFVPVFNSKSFSSEDEAIVAVRATDGKILWKFGLSNMSKSPPVVFKDNVYVLERYGGMYALEKNSGQITWRSHADTWIDHFAPIARDNILYFGGWGEKHPITALDTATKKILWKYETSFGKYSPFILDKDNFFFADQGCNLHCLNAETGEIIWKCDSVCPSGAPVCSDKNIFIIEENGRIQSIDKRSGKRIWQARISKNVDSPLVYADGRLFFSDKKGFFYCVDAVTGIEIWRYDNKYPVFRTTFDVDTVYFQTIWHYGSFIFFIATDGCLYALNTKDGSLALKYKPDIGFYTAPVMAGDTLYISNIANEVRAYKVVPK
jgi:outer membrane protein assembly factor BamB